MHYVLFMHYVVYDDDDDDDAGLSSGAGTNLKVGDTYMSGAKRRKKNLALQVQSVVLVSASVWSVQFDHFLEFLFFLLSVPPCPVICKSVGTYPRALDRVSVTFVLQFHTRKHYKNSHSI